MLLFESKSNKCLQNHPDIFILSQAYQCWAICWVVVPCGAILETFLWSRSPKLSDKIVLSCNASTHQVEYFNAEYSSCLWPCPQSRVWIPHGNTRPPAARCPGPRTPDPRPKNHEPRFRHFETAGHLSFPYEGMTLSYRVALSACTKIHLVAYIFRCFLM